MRMAYEMRSEEMSGEGRGKGWRIGQGRYLEGVDWWMGG